MRSVTPSTIVTIKVNGKEFPTLVRDRQHHVLTGTYLHIDFMVISLKEKVRTLVNLEITGVAPAVKDMDAILITGIDQIEVEALPQDLPESISVDISGIKSIGDGLYVKDLIMPEGVECLSEPEEMIIVATAQVIEEEEEEEEEELEEALEGEVEPEVIEKGKKEEGEEE
jgi:large subunit ribosomal protein L25